MKKYLLTLLVCFSAYIQSFAQTSSSYTDEYGVTWQVTLYDYDSKTATIEQGTTGNTEYLVIPEKMTINEVEYTVTGIGPYAFAARSDIETIVLPSSITYICDYRYENINGVYTDYGVFSHNPNLKSVDFNGAQCNIGSNAFRDCSSLESVSGLSGCTLIGSSAFNGCSSLELVDDLQNCTSIGDDAFRSCISLVSVGDLPECTFIGSYAFISCSKLTLVGDLPKCTSLGSSAFMQCASLKSVGDLSNCESIKSETFFQCTSLESVKLSACTLIGSRAFCDCPSLKSVGDLSKCTSIGEFGFTGCKWLESVGDLSKCNSIGEAAFNGCSSLTSVNLSNCTLIGGSAFQGCSSLTSVGDLSKCTLIRNNAFSNCSSLESVGKLSNCTSIGGYAFYNCSSLASVDLSKCTSIEEWAFCECSSLESVGELKVCTSIGSLAFHNCSSLNKIVLSATTMATATGSDLTSECTTVLVPANLVDAYRVADNWKDMAVRIISMDAKYDLTGENAVTVTAQENASGLLEVITEENVGNVMSLKVIGDINSYDILILRTKMHNLHYLDLSKANIVENANQYPYYQTYYTQDNIFPPFAFYGMMNLSYVKLPETIKSIGYNAFCSSNISEVIIPQGVTSIMDDAFNACNRLKSVTIPSTVTTIGMRAFSGCSSLQEIKLPSSITSIGTEAFGNCNKLNTVTIPSSVKEMGNAFFGCFNLQSVYATSVLPISIGQDAFSTWKTATLYVPKDDDTDWNTTYYAYYWDTQWSQFATIKGWKPTYDYFYVDGEYEMETGEIPGTGEKNPDADFGKESGFIVDEGAEQGMGEVNVDSDGESGGSIIAQGGTESSDEGNVTAEKLNIKIQVNSGRWYFFSFPYDIPKADITCDANYVFRHYDGNGRANGNSGWKNVTSTDGEYLKAGKGYIFQCDKSTDLILTVDNPKFNGKDKKTGLDEAKGESTNAQDANWNFVGNPFLSYFNMEDIDYNCPITVWNGSSYEAIRPGDDDYSFHPFQAFFVQKPEDVADISFDAKGRETKTQSEKNQKEAKARRMMRKAAANRQLINLEISDGQNTDKTRVVFNQAKADAYEMDCDAAKFMSTEAVPQIYTLDSKGVKYAINERPDGNVKIGYEAKKAGLFTISAMRMEKAVSLLDKQTGELVSLEEPFTFSSKVGTFNDRFELVIGSPTDIRSVDSDKQGASTSDSFTLGGIRTDASEKGIIISDGKKHLNK